LLAAISLCCLAIGIQTAPLLGQDPSPFDREQLAELLNSNKIMSLRQATRVIKADPDRAQEFLPAIAERASHPELTEVFGWLLKLNSNPEVDDQLIRQAASYHPRTRELIEAAVKAAVRDRGNPKPVQPRIVNSRPSSPPASKTKPVVDFNALQPNLKPTRRNTPVFTQKQKAIRSAEPLGSTAAQLARLTRLNQRSDAEPLGTDDWGFLFKVMDQKISVDRSPAAATRTSAFYPVFKLARTIIADHYPADKQKTWDYILDPETTDPDRILMAIERFTREDRETFDFVWQLADTENELRRRSALNRLYFKRSFADDYVDELIARVSIHPDRLRDFAIPVFRISQVISDQSRSKILAWQLSQFERAFAEAEGDEPIHQQQIEIVNQAKSVVAPMPHPAQYSWVARIVAQANASPHPRAYVGLLQIMRCDLEPAADLLERLLAATEVKRDRLQLARLLYRAKGPQSNVYPMFREVISDPNSDRDELSAALMGVMEVGEGAVEVVPDLVRVLTDPARSGSHGTTLSAIAKIGPAAADAAAPTLIAMLTDPDQSKLQRQVAEALKTVKPKADTLLPTLTRIALDQDPNVKYDAPTRRSALRIIAEYGREAAGVVDQLKPLTESPDHLISVSAKICIGQIERSRR
jgi:hypothetical protein